MESRTLAYGTHPDQVGDLMLAADGARPLLVCFHGGFWRMPYDRRELDAIVADLAREGWSSWNAEYRRVGVEGGGWPGTGADAVAALEFAGTLVIDGRRPAVAGVIVIGFSAGGHLALWSGAEVARRGGPRVRGVVGLAPVVDLAEAERQGLGRGAVRDLFGREVELVAGMREASPRARLPLGVTQAIIHGTSDDAVPIAMSREYVRAAGRAGDRVALHEVPGGGHGDHLDPSSAAHLALKRVLDGFLTEG